jgi:sugar phosphate isomerase/epimerase
MKVSISNIAWDVEEDAKVAELLHKYHVDAIDIAPGKYFPDVLSVSDEQIDAVKSWWSEKGVSIIGMQSLLFGTQGLNLFDNEDVQQRMLNHLDAVCRIASGVGATKLVFGSPKNRDRKQLRDDEVKTIAIDFFQRLGDIAKKHSVIICLEPNPTCYGANFMTTTVETAEVVTAVNHSSIKMQLDTGAMTINNEDAFELIQKYNKLIGHIHISEPGLAPPARDGGDHIAFSQAINENLHEHYVTIEMVAIKEQPHTEVVEKTLNFVVAQYGEVT